MIIDCLIDMQYEGIDCVEEIYERAVDCDFTYIVDAFHTKNNDKIRKALRQYLIEEGYNRRYYKVIRETNWVK